MKKTILIIALLLLILAVVTVGVVEQHRELSRQRAARAAIQAEQIKRQEAEAKRQEMAKQYADCTKAVSNMPANVDHQKAYGDCATRFLFPMTQAQ